MCLAHAMIKRRILINLCLPGLDDIRPSSNQFLTMPLVPIPLDSERFLISSFSASVVRYPGAGRETRMDQLQFLSQFPLLLNTSSSPNN